MRGRGLALAVGAVAATAASLAFARSRRARGSTAPTSPPEVVAGLRARRTERTAELARLSTQAGVNYARMQAGSVFAGEERRAELQARFELQTAEQAAAVLGNMKGAVMKLGQMASYLDGGLPEPVRDALAQMQQDAPPMSADLVRSVVTAELGGEPEEVFASFEPEPMAAASIGQVHRAVTHDGRRVAVKVQYPGVDDAIRADLDNSDLLFGAMGMLFSGLDPEPIVDELRDRLTEELDYTIEAANQQRFADHYRGHPTISVPDVVTALSTSRLLTTELAEGHRFSEAVRWSQAERDLASETIFRFAFGGIYRLGMFNGDPHPGNYVLRPGGQVTFLDFGLCKIFTPEEVEQFQRVIIAMVLDGDPAAVRRAWTEVGVLRPDTGVTDQQVADYFGHFFEMVRDDEVKTVTPEFSSASVRRYFDLSGPYGDVMRAVTLPSFMVVIQRINLGLYSLFGELHATNNWRRLAEEIWPFVDGPPSTEMGERIREWEIAAGHRPS